MAVAVANAGNFEPEWSACCGLFITTSKPQVLTIAVVPDLFVFIALTELYVYCHLDQFASMHLVAFCKVKVQE